jgi:hypothetical protein
MVEILIIIAFSTLCAYVLISRICTCIERKGFIGNMRDIVESRKYFDSDYDEDDDDDSIF